VWGALLVVLVLPACKRPNKVETVEEARQTAGFVAMNDANAASQLLKGFYGVEAGAWRWTAGKFTVLLKPPANAATKGAKLELKLTIPQPVIAKLNQVTLTAKVGDTPLPPQTFNKTGDYTYAQDVPATAFAGVSGPVRVDFWLDKAMPPTSSDLRELGIVVFSAGLESK
jgi:hypothetical protein